MIYFSQTQGKKVYTEDGVLVGKLKDLVFQALETPLITKMVVRNSHGDLVIPISYLRKLNSQVYISKNYQIAKLSENELYLVKNLLDKQIIDIQGNKIVRVNDVFIQDKPSLLVAGVDIGYLGILRWFRLEDIATDILGFFKLRITSRFLPWGDIQPLELARGKVVLKIEDTRLEKIPPEDLADHLEKTTIKNIKRVLNLLDEEYQAEVIGNLNISFQTELFRQFDPEDAAKIISLIDPDEAADILLTLPEEKRADIIHYLEPELKKEIQYLFNLSQTPIGELLTTEYMTVTPEQTVRDVLDKIRKETSDFSFFFHIYVVNKNNELIGVLNLHELVMQNVNQFVYKFMTQNVVVVHLTTPKEIAIKKMLKYKLFGLPVIDQSRHILGIVTFDDVAEFVLEKI